ncbi:MAG: tetratricopeptide repeat protein [Chloroflexi bacterium]|nr:MAG: tetratricopeptide repeat protein [Chloroflexota bacterium]
MTSNTSHKKPSRKELRVSLLLPVIITVVVWIIGLAIYALAPGEVQFNTVIAILIGGGLVSYLIFYMRDGSVRLRMVALTMAIPALIGMTLGMVNGRFAPIIIGFASTFLLLITQRALSTPFSYRAAAQAFDRDDTDRALMLINKSISARPDFAESYQLRAMIRMVNQQFESAEQDASKAIELQPKSDQFHNTLGQIFWVNGRYPEMRDTYQQAISINPDRAMHHYHLGLSHYRLGDFRDAAESFSVATRKTVPTMAYDLLTHFYLWRSLLEIGETDMAQTTHDTMQNFADGLEQLKDQLTQSNLEHIRLLANEMEAIAKAIQTTKIN